MVKRVKRQPEFSNQQVDIERNLVSHISETGKEEIKKRRKANLSVYYLKDGRVTEIRPNKTEVLGKEISSRWIKLDRKKRSFMLK